MNAKQSNQVKCQWMGLEFHWRKNSKLATDEDTGILHCEPCSQTKATYHPEQITPIKQDFTKMKWGMRSFSKVNIMQIFAQLHKWFLQWIGQKDVKNHTNWGNAKKSNHKTFPKILGLLQQVR